MKQKKYIGELLIIISTILWGCIGFFSRNLNESGFSSVQIVTVRAVFTTLFVGVFLLITNPQAFRINLRDLWMFAGSGIASFEFFNICYMSSIKENSLSVACILMYTSPIWVVLISTVIFKEKITLRKIISLVMCFGGCALVCLSASLRLTKIGLVFGICSGFGYALYSIFAKIASKKYSSFTIIFYTFLFASLGTLPICNIPQTFSLITVPSNIVFVLGITVINTTLPYLLYTSGLSKISAGKASVISLLEPIVSAITGWVIFSEKIGVNGFIGMAVVIIGLVILELNLNEYKKSSH